MELRRYWNVIRRRLPVVLTIPLLVLVGSLALFFIQPVTYTAKANIQMVIVPPQAGNDTFYRYADYYNFLATEYMVDDLVEVLNGNVFIEDVDKTLQGPSFNVAVPVDHIRGALDVTRKHRVIQIAATAPQRALAQQIAAAAVQTLQQDPVKYFSRGNSNAPINARALVIDQPLQAKSNRIRSLLNVALQTVLGLFAGLGLAFLLEYLDDRLRDAEMVRDALGLPVLARVPGPGGGHDGRFRARRVAERGA